MKMFEFSVIATGPDPREDDFEARFYDNGCDDALVSFQNGHTIIDFAREAETFDAAVVSALQNVASSGARIDRVEPDPLVSLADIAKRSNLTRAAITNYHKGHRGEAFPAPIARVTSESPLWDWASVAFWLARNRRLSVDAAVQAEVVRQANQAVAAGETLIADALRQRAEDCERMLRA